MNLKSICLCSLPFLSLFKEFNFNDFIGKKHKNLTAGLTKISFLIRNPIGVSGIFLFTLKLS